MLLAEIAATSDALAATGSRNAKIALIADLLRALDPDEIVAATGFLIGAARQGRIGIGWAALQKVATEISADAPSLQVLDLDRALDDVQAATGQGSVAARAEILRSLFARATPREHDLMRRLITGEMLHGALEGVMVDAIAKASEIKAAVVRRAAMLAGDLRQTARIALVDGEEALAAVGLSMFRPVQPMLASSAETVAEALAITGRASVEWKLDGIRVQIHRDGDEVRIYTRNLNDITERLPDVVAIARALPCTQVLLDGEAIALDDDERPYLFQETMSEIGKKGGPQTLRAVVYLFDVLHLDGQDLIDKPLAERAELLARIAGQHLISSTVTVDPGVADRVLADALAAGHEGVVVKAIDSPYQAGRRGKAWVKVKPVHTLDLVVLAAEWGHGRRKGWLSNLHLGARNPDGGFVMVGKTFKGLTDQTLTWQTEQLLAREVERDGIVVHVRPEMVVEIELDGVQVSTRYPGGVALRFARVLRYRGDKDAADADTIGAVRALLQR